MEAEEDQGGFREFQGGSPSPSSVTTVRLQEGSSLNLTLPPGPSTPIWISTSSAIPYPLAS